MKLRPLFALLLCVLAVGIARGDDDDFPGLRQVMTPREWQHSGLDQLTPDQIAIIDSALTRDYAHTVAKAAKDAAAKAVQTQKSQQAQLATDSSRYGLPEASKSWKDQPVLYATVVRWVSDNRFLLDNNQVWQGMDYIPYELKGHSIRIEPRPFGEFVLILDGKNTTIRVQRVQ